jgi:hypothetical protein
MIIKEGKIDRDDGLYELKIILKQKNTDKIVYSGEANVLISKKKIIAFDSNWNKETKIFCLVLSDFCDFSDLFDFILKKIKEKFFPSI